MITTVQAKGREGVWRIMCHKYYGTWESTAKDEEEGVINLQPELNGFYLAENPFSYVQYIHSYISEKQCFQS